VVNRAVGDGMTELAAIAQNAERFQLRFVSLVNS